MTASTYRMSRRAALALSSATVASASIPWAHAADSVLHIPINMPFTGEEAEGATLVKNGALLAIEEIQRQGWRCWL